mmetsp:Transcript_34952/g.78779  ORF Transcript_34952/g.78779 Transcript_34952/m.78779 type:complete len:204 (-) Transcript_34952:148-759(-)
MQYGCMFLVAIFAHEGQPTRGINRRSVDRPGHIEEALRLNRWPVAARDGYYQLGTRSLNKSLGKLGSKEEGQQSEGRNELLTGRRPVVPPRVVAVELVRGRVVYEEGEGVIVKLVGLDGVPYVVRRQRLSGPNNLLVRRTPTPALRSAAGRRGGVHDLEYPAVRGLGIRGLVLEYSEAVGERVGLGGQFTTTGDGDRRPEVCE